MTLYFWFFFHILATDATIIIEAISIATAMPLTVAPMIMGTSLRVVVVVVSLVGSLLLVCSLLLVGSVPLAVEK